MSRWFLIVIAVIVAVAIWHEVSSDMDSQDTRVTPVTPVTMEQDRISEMEATASVLAKAQAREAFATAQRACGEPASAACGETARSVAYVTARSILMDGGCITWETSTWDPRAMRERNQPNTPAEAEAACERQAQAITDRVVADVAPRGR